jgi:hypothetical protein
VTIRDAIGCEVSVTRAIGTPACGRIAPTETSCEDFIGGTAGDLTQMCFGLDTDGTIKNVAPGVFFYYTKVISPSNGLLMIDIVQTTTPSFAFVQVHQDQVRVYDAACGRLLNLAKISIKDGQVGISVSGTTIGQVIIVQVKYSANSLVGTAATSLTNVRYDFATHVNNVPSDGDPDGILLRNCVGRRGAAPLASLGQAETGAGDLDGLEPYRPSPNPFVETVRMAYVVDGTDEPVDIGVYDVTGRRIRSLVTRVQGPGRYQVGWDGRKDDGTRATNGIYFLRATVGRGQRMVRVAMLR